MSRSLYRMVGSILCCAAQNIPMLIVGRIINGFCVGICSAQVPVYISEIAPPSKRGRLISMQQWAITWGILIMYFICYGCSFIDSESSFRIPWGVQMVPAALLGGALFILPESPRWLAKQDRWEESLAVLTLVHGKGDPNSPFVHQEMEEIREVVEFERHNANVTYLELFKPHMINRTMIGLFTQIWSQLTGMNVMSTRPSAQRHLRDFGEECKKLIHFHSVLYRLHLQHGRHRQRHPPIFRHRLHHQRLHDRSRADLARPLGPSRPALGRCLLHVPVDVL